MLLLIHVSESFLGVGGASGSNITTYKLKNRLECRLFASRHPNWTEVGLFIASVELPDLSLGYVGIY